MKQKYFWIISLIIFFIICAATIIDVKANNDDVSTWTKKRVSDIETLAEALSSPEPLNVILTEDINVDKTLNVAGEKAISGNTLIRKFDGVLILVGDDATLTLSDIVINGYSDSPTNGVAIQVGTPSNYTNSALNIAGNVTIKDNATRNIDVTGNKTGVCVYGSAIYIAHGCSISGSGLTATGNKAIDASDTGSDYLARGAGLYLARDANASLSNSSFINNCCISEQGNTTGGGAIYAAAANSLTLSTCKIEENHATYGAGIYTSNCKTSVTKGSSISKNVGEMASKAASVRGGGIFATNDNSSVTVEDSTIKGNVLMNEFGTEDNHVYGPGICNTKGKLEVINSTISENHDTCAEDKSRGLVYGGGICSNGLGNEVYIKNSTISDNEANIGGGVYVVDSQLSVDSVHCDRNTAHRRGGGFCIYTNSNVTLLAGSVSNNVCDAPSGDWWFCRYGASGLYMEEGSTLRLGETLVENNKTINDGSEQVIPEWEGLDPVLEQPGAGITGCPTSETELAAKTVALFDNVAEDKPIDLSVRAKNGGEAKVADTMIGGGNAEWEEKHPEGDLVLTSNATEEDKETARENAKLVFANNITSAPAGAAISSNGYIYTGTSYAPKITKAWEGANFETIDSKFELRPDTTKNETAPMPVNAEEEVATATVTGTGDVSFGDITYDTPGYYYYTITELKPENKRVEYDSDVHTLAVEIKWNEDEEEIASLEATGYYDYEYQEGSKLKVEESDESKSEEGATVNWAVYSDGTLVINGDNSSNNSIHGERTTYYGSDFDTSKAYTSSSSGTYKIPWYSAKSQIKSVEFASITRPLNCQYWFYEMSKLEEVDINNLDASKISNMSYMFYNCSSLKVIYCENSWESKSASERMFRGCQRLAGAVNFDPWKIDGTMANTTTGYFTTKYPPILSGASTLTITNTMMKIPFIAQIQKKVIDSDENNWNNYDFKTNHFEFLISSTNEATLPEQTIAITDDSGKAAWDKIEFSSEGTYEYVITEVEGNILDIEYDVNEYHLTVHADIEGNVTQEWESVPLNGAIPQITNVYRYKVPLAISLQKRYLEQGTEKEIPMTQDQFTFNLSPADTNPEAPMPENPKSKMDTDGNVTWEEIKYDEIGEWDYIVKEEDPNDENIIWDKEEHKVHVKVTRNEDQTLSATWTWDEEDTNEVPIIVNYNIPLAPAPSQKPEQLPTQETKEEKVVKTESKNLAKQILPDTGVGKITVLVIIGISIFGIRAYKKYRLIRNIK